MRKKALDPRVEIQKGDPRARRRALLIGVPCVLAGGILILFAEANVPALEEWLSQDPQAGLPLVLTALLVAVVLPILGFSVYLWRVGGRIVRAERFPETGTAVLLDTVILRGRSAQRRGRALQLCAVILILRRRLVHLPLAPFVPARRHCVGLGGAGPTYSHS